MADEELNSKYVLTVYMKADGASTPPSITVEIPADSWDDASKKVNTQKHADVFEVKTPTDFVSVPQEHVLALWLRIKKPREIG